MRMHTRCPECGLLFDREPGYFLGAMMVSYGISVVLYTLLYLALKQVTNQTLPVLVAEIAVLYLPLVPWVFRYSRITWIYIDQAIDPEK
jgi:hypothetical protein